jgi:hypothetical protein
LEPDLRDPRDVEELAQREAGLASLRSSLRAATRSIRPLIGAKRWIEFADANAAVRTAEFELAFNLGFEHGIIAARAESKWARPTAADRAARRFQTEVRRLFAASTIPARDATSVLLRICWAMAFTPPAQAPPTIRRKRAPQ